MWCVGQRIISQSEPELGLGVVEELNQEEGLLAVGFPISEEKRRYVLRGAPIERLILKVGSRFSLCHEGDSFVVEQVKEDHGLITYQAGENFYREDEIFLEKSRHAQEELIESLLAGSWSSHRSYELRKQAWQIRGQAEKLKSRGLVAAKVRPLSHQLFIASEVARRKNPRVLLADEVGLGKTIEAGLIYSAMRHLGRAQRVLILAPESLVHQWMAELYRKFGVMFAVLNQERCEAEEASRGMSAFEACQQAIVASDFLLSDPQKLSQAMQAKWDLIIMDEAHHLRWNEDIPDPKWVAMKLLSQASKGLLLLTATPTQFGSQTQFGLLQLVDPDRFTSYDDFLEEEEKAFEVASLAKKVVARKLSSEDKKNLKALFVEDQEIQSFFAKDLTTESSQSLLKALVDRHGSGRVYFRNRRENLKGFPQRRLLSVPLTASPSYQKLLLSSCSEEISDKELMGFATGRWNKEKIADDDAKYQWFESFLKTKKNEKILVICSSKEGVLDLAGRLKKNFSFSTRQKDFISVFHEGLSVVERDKEAARFVDTSHGGVLITSEIGGEGRNFQCAKTLVLMDIPRLPDLLEQRVGRLDRIGQGKQIDIVVPWLKNSPEEAFFRWYDEGLNAFSQSWNGANPVLENFAAELLDLFRVFLPKDADFKNKEARLLELVSETKEYVQSLRKERKESVDILLDLNSFHPEKGDLLVSEIDSQDDDISVEFFIRSIFDFYGVSYEDFDDNGSITAQADSLMFIDNFPGLSQEGETTITFDRDTALAREELLFLTADHPLMEEIFSLLSSKREGACSVCRFVHPQIKSGFILELSFVLEASGPRSLELGRYLPLSTCELRFDHQGKLIKTGLLKPEDSSLFEVNKKELLPALNSYRPWFNDTILKAQKLANSWGEDKIKASLKQAGSELSFEIFRLEALAKVNPQVKEEEILWQREHLVQVKEALTATSMRLDSLRLILFSS